MTRTEPRNHTMIICIMFVAMIALGSFQEPFRILIFVGLFGLGMILGTQIQAYLPNLFRQKVGGGDIEDN